jgi:type I restriction enzyme S subunit
MASEWPLRPLGQLTQNFDSVRVPVKEADRIAGPYPYYGASGIVDHVDKFLFDGEYLLIAEDGENLRTRNTPVAFLARGKFWVNNHAHIVLANDKANTRFLMYALAATDISGYLTGSTMPKLTQGNMNRIPVVTPPLKVQQAIAGILGALDDKIELNRRMNRTLEEMARAIFKSWFVDFDPVRAKAAGQQPPNLKPEIAALFPDTFEESKLGEIPKGWRVGNLGDIIQIHDSKRIPLSSRERAKRQGSYRYYGAAGIVDHVDDFLFDGIYVLVGEDGSVVTDFGNPVVQYVWGKFWVNNHAHVLKACGGFSDEHLLVLLQQIYIVPFVTGAVQPKLNQKNMNAVPIIRVKPEINTAFNTLIEPIFTKERTLNDEIGLLAAIRDTLLPVLLSGQLQIADAERIVGRWV